MTGLLAKSLNVGASTLAIRMGQQTFYKYMRAFGLGRPTGIDLQHEAAGLLITRDKNPDRWSEAILASNSFGQGIATTPIQMVASIGAVANDGVLVQPHVVKKIIRGDRVDEAKVVAVGHPISRETANTLSDMLAEAVRREVPEATVDGYTIAGKTGTAQIPIPGGYDDPWTIGAFIAYAPAARSASDRARQTRSADQLDVGFGNGGAGLSSAGRRGCSRCWVSARIVKVKWQVTISHDQ